jgi:hypothetical protein
MSFSSATQNRVLLKLLFTKVLFGNEITTLTFQCSVLKNCVLKSFEIVLMSILKSSALKKLCFKIL